MRLWNPIVPLLVSVALANCQAGIIEYEIQGRTSATVGSTFYQNVDFSINFAIDENSTDQFSEQNRGAYSGGVTTLSIPQAGIVAAVSSNITGLFLQDFGSTILNLVDPANFFGSAALGLNFGQSVFTTVDSLTPFNEPTPDPTSAQGGLAIQFSGNLPNVTLNSISSASVSNGTATVPEPSSAAFVMLFAFGMCTQRRRGRRRKAV